MILSVIVLIKMSANYSYVTCNSLIVYCLKFFCCF